MKIQTLWYSGGFIHIGHWFHLTTLKRIADKYTSNQFGYNTEMIQYVALLRGINVGGKNLIKMTALKECFEALGFQKVRTYIQSGNVLFATPRPDQTTLTNQIEDALSITFSYTSRVVLR